MSDESKPDSRFADPDDTFASRLRGVLSDAAIKEVGVIRQLKPGDVVVLKLNVNATQAGSERFADGIRSMMRREEWAGIRWLILPHFAELVEVRDARKEGGDAE